MMNMRLTASKMPFVALLISSALLGGAWFFQYGLGYAPCQMCYWQRHAHKAVIAVALAGGLIHYKAKTGLRLTNLLLILAFLVSAGLALWHVGVEYKWWEGPKSCAVGLINPGHIPSGQALLESLNNPVKPPACSDAVWHFLGLSMAGWNMLISLASAAIIAIFGLRKRLKPV